MRATRVPDTLMLDLVAFTMFVSGAVMLVVAYAHVLEPGSLADWVNAVATSAAFIAASIAAWLAYKSFRTQISFTRRAQAALISVWQETVIHPATSDTEEWASIQLFVRNASEVPVYDVWVRCFARPLQGPPKAWSEDDDEVVEVEGPIFLGLVPPDREPDTPSVSSRRLVSLKAEYERQGKGPYVEVGVAIEFTDAAGTGWVRRVNGRLEEL